MMTHRTALVAIGCALLMGLATQATAAEIIFEHEATGSITGTLDGVPFSTNSIRLVGTGDTEDVTHSPNFGGFYLSWHTSSFVEIAGLGTFDFTSGTGSVVNNGNLVAVFVAAPVGIDLLTGPVDPAFADWDMQTSIGPITGTAQLQSWGFTNMHVTAGHLIFGNATVETTFTATVVPAPYTLSLVLAAGALGRRRRRS